MTGIDTASRRTLYPPIEPYRTGRLDVGDGHSLYWEQCGNPGGKPAVILHGGPGAGCSPDHRRQFDPARYNVTPVRPARLRPLDSARLAGGQHDLASGRGYRAAARAWLGIERWLVFGGSWGSTLALAYAQTHPERATELVLRGIFTFRQTELDWLYQYGASEIFPDKWEEFLAADPRRPSAATWSPPITAA